MDHRKATDGEQSTYSLNSQDFNSSAIILKYGFSTLTAVTCPSNREGQDSFGGSELSLLFGSTLPEPLP